MNDVNMDDAIGEVRFLRQVIASAILGDRIIADQLAISDNALHRWVVGQARANMAHLEAQLAISTADFPDSLRLSWEPPIQPERASARGEGE